LLKKWREIILFWLFEEKNAVRATFFSVGNSSWLYLIGAYFLHKNLIYSILCVF